MTKSDVVLMFLAVSASWIFVIKSLINGKKITYQIEQEKNNRLFNSLLFFVISLIIVYRILNFYGILSACLISLAGILYSCIPSGFNDFGIFINGRFYPYSKMEELKFVKDSRIQLRFCIKRKYHTIFGKDSDEKLFKDIAMRYGK